MAKCLPRRPASQPATILGPAAFFLGFPILVEVAMRLLTFAVVALGLAVAGASAGDAIKKERKRLQGTWVVQSFHQDGKANDEIKGTELTFAGDEVTLRMKKDNEQKEKKMKYKIDPTQKPKTIDIDAEKGTMRAIYELKGDTLRVCHKRNESERPTEFSDKDGVLVTLKRKKASE
jgi:uncharacterized protein (TIGR03067 family)